MGYHYQQNDILKLFLLSSLLPEYEKDSDLVMSDERQSCHVQTFTLHSWLKKFRASTQSR